MIYVYIILHTLSPMRDMTVYTKYIPIHMHTKKTRTFSLSLSPPCNSLCNVKVSDFDKTKWLMNDIASHCTSAVHVTPAATCQRGHTHTHTRKRRKKKNCSFFLFLFPFVYRWKTRLTCTRGGSQYVVAVAASSDRRAKVSDDARASVFST